MDTQFQNIFCQRLWQTTRIPRFPWRPRSAYCVCGLPSLLCRWERARCVECGFVCLVSFTQHSTGWVHSSCWVLWLPVYLWLDCSPSPPCTGGLTALWEQGTQLALGIVLQWLGPHRSGVHRGLQCLGCGLRSRVAGLHGVCEMPACCLK